VSSLLQLVRCGLCDSRRVEYRSSTARVPLEYRSSTARVPLEYR
jgi:hypothetical protein